MIIPRKKEILRIRVMYPRGTRVRLEHMDDPQAIPCGTEGTVLGADDAGQLLMEWDNGRTLSLLYGEDRFTVIPMNTVRLYMPLTGTLYPRDEWGDLDEHGFTLDGHELLEHASEIALKMHKYRLPEEAERGLMHWYGEHDTLVGKVRDAVFTVEVRDGELWGVAECCIAGELTENEFARFREYLAGQASDGWGEGFEQQDIRTDDGVLNVHLWNDGDWSIMTADERFGERKNIENVVNSMEMG